MERNYVLLMGLFLLLVAIDCSSSDPKGNVNERTGLDQNVGSTVDPIKEKGDYKSVSDSIGIKKVKDNGGDQINGSEGGFENDTSKSNLDLQSDSNKGENWQKEGKESSAEDNQRTGGEKEGNKVQKGQEGSNVEAKGKMDGERVDNNVQKGQEESNVEAKGKTDGEKEGNNVQKGQEESNVEAKGKTDGEKEGNNVQKGQEESNVVAKGKSDGEKEDDNVQKGQEESNVELKEKTDGGREVDNVRKGQEEESNVEAKGSKDGEKKENPDDSVDPKKVNKEKDNTQDSVLLPLPTRKDGFQGEECDSSNMCMDKNKMFAACLQVPGNESPDLSLLIQNKGKGPLTIKIYAPSFVQLEETDVELREKQDRKVKVSIKNSGTENLIVLKDGSGECSLDFKDLIVQNSAESYINFLSTPTTAVIFVAAIMILASGWICTSFRRRLLTRSGLKYQRLDMELPVSGGATIEPDVNDGWDNSWGDNWDDEEAPMTPSIPVTPSLSYKGLASRRLSKEGWKD